jgi:methylenetetrahydrofolate reductase (NADPH)
MPDFPLLRDELRPSVGAKRVTDVLAARAANSEPTLSFEFFPPKDEDGAATLWRSFDKLLEVNPDFVSVTYGAGGSNRETSLAVVDRMAKQVLTIGHLTCVGATRASTREVIDRFEAAGVSSILALRGDSPRDNPNALAEGELKTALELVELVARDTNLEVGVAAFPEKHPESPDLAHDAKVLSLKQSAGASYAMTQLFFTVEAYTDLVESSKQAGATMPIIPGLMPISNADRIVRMAEMSGAKLPTELLKKFETADEAQARIIGMDYSIKLASDLVAAGAPGLHIFSLNLAKAALEVARGAGLCR